MPNVTRRAADLTTGVVSFGLGFDVDGMLGGELKDPRRWVMCGSGGDAAVIAVLKATASGPADADRICMCACCGWKVRNAGPPPRPDPLRAQTSCT